MSAKDIRDKLLNLSNREKKERKKALRDYLFYLGETENKQIALMDNDLLGQSWITLDDLDYVPSQVIDNKIKPLINKQARFMFGKEPDILFKPLDKNAKETCEELRQFIDAILNASKFWSNTMKAFRLASVTKRVMLRLEANPGQHIRLYWHDINDFNYEADINDITKLSKAIFVKQVTVDKEVTKQLWNRYTYYMNETENKEPSCYLKVETFKGDNLENPINVTNQDTELSKIPCWVITNEQTIVSPYGQSDIKDLKPLQDSYNRRLSDFNDSLRFLMFGQTAIIDATKDTVNSCNIAPNSLMALKSEDDAEGNKQAKVQRVESNFTNAEPVKMYLKMLEDSMYEKLGIPKSENLQKVPSAKSIKYMYTELVARCEEKWHDWEPIIRSMLRLIVEACSKFKSYDNWKEEWNNLLFTIILNKNYPIPEDEEDQKRLAMEEVQNNVRSHRSYIKDYSNDEDYEEHFKETLEDIKSLNEAEQDIFEKRIDNEDNSGGDL
ncbi:MULTISPECIES: phage portal protein [Clostridium]|uniref:Phage portal protein n=1 Tax=Clostridium novyi B str. ATCC 27606 TaxID=1443123 RepID=A0AA40M1U4_CLONO|nr:MULTISPECIES: phage portal protein [Clostridium]KEI08156.1 phage portal protein [Clostridium novyi B str. NCTC 9691]KEI11495.1 phage portal protein [Clostridium novyi B str. ATCC 27606]KLU74264.1 phage portal protein [Clostridium botulinum V891]